MKPVSDSHKEVTEGIPAIYPRLWRYCLAITGNPENAEDVAQSACLRAIERSDQYQAGTKLDRWVFRIAQRLWINELRSQAIRIGGGITTIDEIDIPDSSPDQESNLFARQVLLEVMALPEAQRTTVVLVYVEGFSYKEAAETLSIPIGTVMSRLAAARAKLNSSLEEKKSGTV